MITLLEALTRRNVGVIADATISGSNTAVDTTISPENWQPWIGFDYATLTRIFREELRKEYRGDSDPRPLRKDLCIHNEESFDDLLRRFVIPTVNYALDEQGDSCHYGRGTRCVAEYKPDWSAVSSMRVDESGAYLNMLPGDTKLDSKWRPEMITELANYDEWQKVVIQIVTYMAYNESRYGFIITDTALVVLRITRRHVGPGLAVGRPRRAGVVAAHHQRYPSDLSIASAGSSYYDDDPMHWDYHDPEYAIIPWTAHGQGTLTIKLALWCLAMMAGNGRSFIDYSYPDLDSWRLGDGGKDYVHNSSGVTRAQLSGNERQQEPNPGGLAGRGGGPIGASNSLPPLRSSEIQHGINAGQLR